MHVTRSTQYLCAMCNHIKHEVARVGYVSADNALVISVEVQMQASVAV